MFEDVAAAQVGHVAFKNMTNYQWQAFDQMINDTANANLTYKGEMHWQDRACWRDWVWRSGKYVSNQIILIVSTFLGY